MNAIDAGPTDARIYPFRALSLEQARVIRVTLELLPYCEDISFLVGPVEDQPRGATLKTFWRKRVRVS